MVTLGEIYYRIRELAGEGKDFYEISDTVREELIEYYSGVGREKLERSPHKSLGAKEAVELLMPELSSVIKREIAEDIKKGLSE